MTEAMVLEWSLLVVVVIIAWLIDRAVRGARLRRQRVYTDLARLTWEQFESVIADAFRRHGYRVDECGGNKADGGVDLILRRDGERTVVQAKHWRRDVVGVALVRELYGVQCSIGAERAMFVALFRYSPDAVRFAAQVNMTLVDGEELLRIIAEGLHGEPLTLPTAAESPVPACPRCDGQMRLRVARQGNNAGRSFWGCVRFPECRGTRDAA